MVGTSKVVSIESKTKENNYAMLRADFQQFFLVCSTRVFPSPRMSIPVDIAHPTPEYLAPTVDSADFSRPQQKRFVH